MIPLLILGAADFYLCLSFLGPLSATQLHWFWVGFVGIQTLLLSQLWLYFIFFKGTAEEKVLFEKPLQKFAFLSMGMMSFLFTFTLLRDVLGILPFLFKRAPWVYSEESTLVIFVLSSLCFLVGALNARFKMVSPRIEVPILNLSDALIGLKIVQLSDVHLGTGPNVKQVKAMVDRALSLKPDLIALTGDIIDGMVDEMKPELQELARLKAEHGVYFVLGNHECYWKHEDSIRVMKEMGIVPLLNQGVEKIIRGHKIFVAGINDPATAHFGGEGIKLFAPPEDSNFNLVLIHQPQYASKIAEFPYHLQLSGHTHGGQFFPWNYLVRGVYAIHGGLGRVKDLWVYVSHGSGYWGPPIRLGTDGEVTEIIVKK